MFLNRSLGIRIISGYLILTAFVIVTGMVGYYGIRTVAGSLHTVGNEEAPIVEMANEMKLNLMKARNAMEEYKAATSTIASDDASALDGIRASYEETLKEYDLFTDAILNGAKLNDGMIVIKTDNQELADMVKRADSVHNEKFQISAARMMELGKGLLSKTAERSVAMKSMEQVYLEVFKDASGIEGIIAGEIASRVSAARNQNEVLSIIKEEMPLSDMANEIKISIAESRIALEEIIQTTDPDEISAIEKEYAETIETFDSVVTAILNGGRIDGREVTATDNVTIKKAVEELDNDHGEFQESGAVLIKKQREISHASKNVQIAMEELDKSGEEADSILNMVEAFAGKEMTNAKNSGDSAVKTSVSLIVIAILVSLVSGILIGVFLTRSITKPLNTVINGLHAGAEQVNSASGQISDSSQSLAEGASEQAASIEETSASIEEISTMTKQNADNADEADQLMTETNNVVEKANESMSSMTESMNDISKASQETSKIVKTIDEIAFQTNLLALNAAVEAARAGDAGAGFAVVADEVRNLAMRAAEAAKNTSEMIESTVKKVETGAKLVDATNEDFVSVAENTGKVGAIVAEIASASKEQAQGIEQINMAVNEMDKITQQNAANAEESASASEEMNAQAASMMVYVDQLQTMIKGGGNESLRVKVDIKSEGLIALHEPPVKLPAC